MEQPGFLCLLLSAFSPSGRTHKESRTAFWELPVWSRAQVRSGDELCGSKLCYLHLPSLWASISVARDILIDNAGDYRGHPPWPLPFSAAQTLLTSTNPFLAILILVVWGYGSGVEPLSNLHQALGSSPTTEEKSFYFWDRVSICFPTLKWAPQVARITGVCHCSLITLISSIRQKSRLSLARELVHPRVTVRSLCRDYSISHHTWSYI